MHTKVTVDNGLVREKAINGYFCKNRLNEGHLHAMQKDEQPHQILLESEAQRSQTTFSTAMCEPPLFFVTVTQNPLLTLWFIFAILHLPASRQSVLQIYFIHEPLLLQFLSFIKLKMCRRVEHSFIPPALPNRKFDGGHLLLS